MTTPNVYLRIEHKTIWCDQAQHIVFTGTLVTPSHEIPMITRNTIDEVLGYANKHQLPVKSNIRRTDLVDMFYDIASSNHLQIV